MSKFETSIKSIIFITFVVLLSACGLFKHASIAHKDYSIELDRKVDLILSTAFSYKGTPYKLGGTNKSGIDCSALVQLSFAKVNVVLPRRSIEQFKVGEEVNRREVQKGDLVFFKFEKSVNALVDHVGIVSNVANRDAIKFIHAGTKKGVLEDDLSKPYNEKAFVKFIRIKLQHD